MSEMDTDLQVEEQATAQDVIDALRLALMAQKQDTEAVKLVRVLLDLAPETDSNRGIQLLMELLAEGSLRVEMVESA